MQTTIPSFSATAPELIRNGSTSGTRQWVRVTLRMIKL
jgi:hypothetical protein